METWLIYIIAPALTSLLTYVLTRTSRKIDATTLLVKMLQEEIERLSAKILKLEQKVEDKEREQGRLMVIIQEAYECKTPSKNCPVLKMQAHFNRQKIPHDENLHKTISACSDCAADVGLLHNTTTYDSDEPDRPP